MQDKIKEILKSAIKTNSGSKMKKEREWQTQYWINNKDIRR